MIYIYRTLWLIGYALVCAIGFILFFIGIPLFLVGCIIYFIKTGDVEDTPDWMVPGKLYVMLDYWYKGLLEKIEDDMLKT